MNLVFIASMSFCEQGPSIHLMKDIITGLLDKGHKISLIERESISNNRYPKWLNHSSINRIIVKKSATNNKNFMTRYISELKYSIKSRKIIKNLKDIDCVFCQSCNTPYIYLIGNYFKKNKIPFIYNAQDIFPNNLLCLLDNKKLIYSFFYLLQKYAYGEMTHIITISEDMKNTIVSSYSVNEKNISVIYNWGNYNTVQNIRNEDNYIYKEYMTNDCFNVVYAGNIGKMQKVEIILDVAEKLKNERINFYFIGKGANLENLISIANQKNLKNVYFYPPQDSNKAIFVYSAADVNLIPLVNGGIYTALPSKTANCIASGKPILACINKESKFANLLIKYGYKVENIDNVDEISKTILEIKNNLKQSHKPHLLLQYFSTENFKKYINVIEKVEENTNESI